MGCAHKDAAAWRKIQGCRGEAQGAQRCGEGTAPFIYALELCGETEGERFQFSAHKWGEIILLCKPPPRGRVAGIVAKRGDVG